MSDRKNPSDEDRLRIEEFERRVADWRKHQWASTPRHIKTLGRILRKSVEVDSVVALKKFLIRHRAWTPAMDVDLRVFRDFLILQRIDLKDLEPTARARLRMLTLKDQDVTEMSADYSRSLEAGTAGDLRCSRCKYFMQAPHDDTPTGDKCCVELGTKGVDMACFGFTLPRPVN